MPSGDGARVCRCLPGFFGKECELLTKFLNELITRIRSHDRLCSRHPWRLRRWPRVDAAVCGCCVTGAHPPRQVTDVLGQAMDYPTQEELLAADPDRFAAALVEIDANLKAEMK